MSVTFRAGDGLIVCAGVAGCAGAAGCCTGICIGCTGDATGVGACICCTGALTGSGASNVCNGVLGPVALVALVSVLRNKKLMGFFIDATGELQKVSTPTPKEAGQSAIVVVVIVLISVALLTFYDFIWQYAVLFVM